MISSRFLIKDSFSFTKDFEDIPIDTLNFREKISPKIKFSEIDALFNPVEYTQVFSEKVGFHPNLSILDLIFNEGPNTTNIIYSSFTS